MVGIISIHTSYSSKQMDGRRRRRRGAIGIGTRIEDVKSSDVIVKRWWLVLHGDDALVVVIIIIDAG
jgi:hypothetical protein